MAEQNKALITFKKGFEKEFEHLTKQGNKSMYIANLVRKDLEANKKTGTDLETIKAALREVLGEIEFTGTVKEKSKEDYTEAINSLFDL